MSQSAVFEVKRAAVSTADNDWLTVVLAIVLIVGLPTGFWLLVLELVAPALGFALGTGERICAAAGLIAALAMIWALLCGSRKPETAEAHGATRDPFEPAADAQFTQI